MEVDEKHKCVAGGKHLDTILLHSHHPSSQLRSLPGLHCVINSPRCLSKDQRGHIYVTCKEGRNERLTRGKEPFTDVTSRLYAL